MPAVFRFIFIGFLPVFNVFSQPCNCHSLVPVHLQPRGKEKSVQNKGTINIKSDTINVQYIYNWQNLYADKTKDISWNDFKAKSKRKKNTPEDSIYILKGYLWLVKKIGFDCDYHMEIGTENRTETRIIVEIPGTNASLQQKVYYSLDSLHLPILNCTTSYEKTGHFLKGIPVIIKGYGFYDAYHKPNTNHGDEHTKKYIWELHPVISIDFIK